MNLIIKADKGIEGRPLAAQMLDGEVIIERLLRLGQDAGFEETFVYAGSQQNMEQLEGLQKRFRFKLTDSLEGMNLPVSLEVDAVYHPERLQKLLKKRKDPAGAILWRMNNKKDIEYAQALLNKRHLYPIARYYAVPLAKKIAGLLNRINVNANNVTIFDAALGVIICLIFLFYNVPLIRFSSLLVLLWWMLDHVDGHLARIRYEQSKFGAFLDSFLGSLIWHSMHLCLALGLYFKSGQPLYLLLGLFYMFGSFMFVFSNSLRSQLKEAGPERSSGDKGVFIKPTGIKRIISLMDDTDVRFHMLAVSSLFNLPVISLLYHAVWCNLRWIMNLTYHTIKSKGA